MATLDASALKSDPKGTQFLRAVLAKSTPAEESKGRPLPAQRSRPSIVAADSDLRPA